MIKYDLAELDIKDRGLEMKYINGQFKIEPQQHNKYRYSQETKARALSLKLGSELIF